MHTLENPEENERGVRRRSQALVDWARKDIWHVELVGVPTFRRWWTKCLRVILLTIRGFVRDRCTRHAMALTYITIFALPPFLAFVFSITKGFGLYRNLKDGPINAFLDSNFGSDEGSQVRQAIDQIFSYVENTPVGSVAAIGLLVILLAVFKLLGAAEFTLNDIWGIRRPRPLVRKVTDYLAIVVVTPILLLSGVSMSSFLNGHVVEFLRDRQEPAAAAVAELEPTSDAGSELEVAAPAEPGDGGTPELAADPKAGKSLRSSALLRLASLLTIVLGMGFVLFTMPNTSVRLGAALLGGLSAGLLWQFLQFGSVYIQVWLGGKNAIYQGLAAIPMLMIWIYLSWTILLVGAEVSCAVQTEPLVASLARTGKLDQRLREIIAPRLAVRVTAAFLGGQAPPTATGLASDLDLAVRAVTDVLDRLVVAGILARTNKEDGEESYLPGRDPGAIRLQDVADALRRDVGGRTPEARGELDEVVDRARLALEVEMAALEANRTLAELARA
ncbi:MAG: membrane protein [Planctomycetota bacterium]|jgi:membrane protein